MGRRRNEEFQLGSGDVFLRIAVGNAQLGASFVSLDGEELRRGDLRRLNLGDVSKLKGKTLNAKTMVTDVNDKTNNLVATYQINDSERKAVYEMTETVAREGDSTIFRLRIKFV